MQKKIKKAQIDTKLRKDLKAIDKKIAKVKEKYYDLLDLKVALKAIARLEKNGYKNLTTLEDFIKKAGLENEIAQATETETETKLLEFIEAIKPVKSLISSNEMTRLIRDDKEDELDAKLAVFQQKK